MIGRLINWLCAGVTPIQLDGTLYMLIAAFGSIQTFFSSDEAYKYVDPYVLFWIKALTGTLLAVVGALKMFRSTSYAEHMTDAKTGKAAARQPENG